MKKRNLYAVLVIIIVYTCSILFGCFTYCTKAEELKSFHSDEYKITLKYNSTWAKNYNYKERYEGPDGFFQIVASTGDNMTVDDIAKFDISNISKPYGSSPKISEIAIDNTEGRLVEPSADQFSQFQDVAEVIFKSPKDLIINGQTYSFIIIYADKYHIVNIAKSIRFIK